MRVWWVQGGGVSLGLEEEFLVYEKEWLQQYTLEFLVHAPFPLTCIRQRSLPGGAHVSAARSA